MAAARAEARRKAILSRGSDRLNKLTTSARGEDAPQIVVHDDPPEPTIYSSTSTFIGDESPRRPASRTPSSANIARRASPSPGGPQPDPGQWSTDQQQQLMRALMGGGPPPGPDGAGEASADDPLAALLAQFTSGAAGSVPPTAPLPTQAKPKPPTRLQRLMPLVHVLACWALLAYFVCWREPEAYAGRTYGADLGGRWERWGILGTRDAGRGGYGVQFVPFFWAFLTLQIGLHSLRIFHGFDAVQPPMLLSLALPHIPPPFPSLIMTGLKYLQLGGLLLDDIAALVVGLGFIVLVGEWRGTGASSVGAAGVGIVPDGGGSNTG